MKAFKAGKLRSMKVRTILQRFFHHDHRIESCYRVFIWVPNFSSTEKSLSGDPKVSKPTMKSSSHFLIHVPETLPAWELQSSMKFLTSKVVRIQVTHTHNDFVLPPNTGFLETSETGLVEALFFWLSTAW